MAVEIDPSRFAVVGVHLGRRAATVALANLTGQVLSARVLPHQSLDLTAVTRLAAELLQAHPDRSPLAAGVVGPWQELGWDSTALAAELHATLGLDLAQADHLNAMARAEFLHQPPAGGVTIFLYARDTAGFVVVDQAAEQSAMSRPWRLDHFPTGSPSRCPCGKTGCLIATVGDQAITQAAYDKGWIPQPRIDLVFRAADLGHPGARSLIATRARTLAALVDHIHRMAEPERIVLAGQAFTADPAVQRLAAQSTTAEVTTTRFGSEIQAYAACAVALQPIDQDPLGLVPQAASIQHRSGV